MANQEMKWDLQTRKVFLPPDAVCGDSAEGVLLEGASGGKFKERLQPQNTACLSEISCLLKKKKKCCSIFSSWTFPFSDHYVLHSDLWELREDRIGMSGLDICRYDYEQVYLSKE